LSYGKMAGGLRRRFIAWRISFSEKRRPLFRDMRYLSSTLSQ